MSDLHLDHSWCPIEHPEADVRINAGDTYESEKLQREISAHFDITVKGNHDYYRHSFPRKEADVGTFVKDGVRFAYATLWTDLTNFHDWVMYQRNLVDSHYISRLTREDYLAKHLFDLEFLRESGADVIVTHHSPFLQSCDPRWETSDSNASFHSNLAGYVHKNFRKIPKLWIHGHTHDACDYVLPFGTRVVCHPRGYPGEKNHKDYKAKVVEI